jgi:hypothetical protein
MVAQEKQAQLPEHQQQEQVAVLLVILQVAITILKVVLLVEEVVVMVGHLHHKIKEMETMEHLALDLVEVEAEEPHLMLQTQ